MANEGYPDRLGSIVEQMFPHLTATPGLAESLQWVALHQSAMYQLYTEQEKVNIQLLGLIFKRGEVGTKCLN